MRARPGPRPAPAGAAGRARAEPGRAGAARGRPAGHRPGVGRPRGRCRRRRPPAPDARGSPARGGAGAARRLAAAAHRRGRLRAGSRCRAPPRGMGLEARPHGRRGARASRPAPGCIIDPDPIHHGRVETGQGADLDVQAPLLNAFEQLLALQAQLFGQLVNARRQRQLLPDATPVSRAGLGPGRILVSVRL